MDGFINESVSKIMDGIGGALQLLLILAFTSLVFLPVTQSLNDIGNILYLIVLLGGGVYFLYRSLAPDQPDARRATSGMLSGLLLWQIINQSGLSGRLGLYESNAALLWVVVALVMVFLWIKVFPLGLRFFTLLLLLNWLGKIYVTRLELSGNWPALLETVFSAVRYLGIFGIGASVWFILFRSRNVLERKYGAAALYFFVLLSFLLF